MKKMYDLSSLRWITHGAAPCAPAVKREMIDWWGPMINEYYGATETGIVVWHNSAEALADRQQAPLGGSTQRGSLGPPGWEYLPAKRGLPGGVLEALATLFWQRRPRRRQPRRHRGSPPGPPGALVTRSKPSLRRVQVGVEVGLLHHSAPSSAPTARSTARLAASSVRHAPRRRSASVVVVGVRDLAAVEAQPQPSDAAPPRPRWR